MDGNDRGRNAACDRILGLAHTDQQKRNSLLPPVAVKPRSYLPRVPGKLLAGVTDTNMNASQEMHNEDTHTYMYILIFPSKGIRKRTIAPHHCRINRQPVEVQLQIHIREGKYSQEDVGRAHFETLGKNSYIIMRIIMDTIT